MFKCCHNLPERIGIIARQSIEKLRENAAEQASLLPYGDPWQIFEPTEADQDSSEKFLILHWGSYRRFSLFESCGGVFIVNSCGGGQNKFMEINDSCTSLLLKGINRRDNTRYSF